MKTLSLVLLSLVAVDCGAQGVSAPPFLTNPDLTPNGSEDAGGPDASADGGRPIPDAGCPALTVPGPLGCVPQITVYLTGTALTVSGDSLYAGYGQQPMLQTFVQAPGSIGSVTLNLAGAGGVPLTQVSPIAAQTDGGVAVQADGGREFDYTWNTSQLAEATYSAQAFVQVGDGGFSSNTVNVVVDRTPPTIDFDLGIDGGSGAQLRNFTGTGTFVATDDGGSGVADVTVTGLGGALQPAYRPGVGQPGFAFWKELQVDLPTTLVTRTGTDLSGQVPIAAATVPFDAWSTEQDGHALVFTAQATDLAGNTAQTAITVPVTRSGCIYYDGINGQPALGGHGEVFATGLYTLQMLNPRTLQLTSTPVPTGAGFRGVASVAFDATQDSNDVFGVATVAGTPTVLSFPDGGPGFSLAPLPEAITQALVVDASDKQILVGSPDCAVYWLGMNAPLLTQTLGFTNCAGVQLSLNGNDVLLSSLETWGLTNEQRQIEFSGPSQQQLVANIGPEVNGQALVPATAGLGWYKTSSGLKVTTPSAQNITNITLNSAGEIVLTSETFANAGNTTTLMKLDGSGNVLWTADMLAPTSSPVLGSDGAIYIVDGTISLRSYDSSGMLHWASPGGTATRDEPPLFTPLFDPCIGTAYVQTPNDGLLSVILDSPGLDNANGAWPMAGHDVFQTNNAGTTAQINCSNHL